MSGELLPVPSDLQGESVHGAVYEVQIDTQGIGCPECVARAFYENIPARFPLKVQWIQVDGNKIRLQVTDEGEMLLSPFLMFLPELLGTIGIVVAFIGLFLVLSFTPVWTVLTIIGGLVLIALGAVLGRTRWQELVGKLR